MSDTFNYWQAELGKIRTAGADDPVKLKLQTSCSETKWLSLRPHEFEQLETFLVELYETQLHDDAVAEWTADFHKRNYPDA